jgi:hypothetical protein
VENPPRSGGGIGGYQARLAATSPRSRVLQPRDCSDFFLPAFGLVPLLGHQGQTFQCQANGSY